MKLGLEANEISSDLNPRLRLRGRGLALKDVNRMTQGRFRRFHQSLWQSGMWMHCQSEILDLGAHFKSKRCF